MSPLGAPRARTFRDAALDMEFSEHGLVTLPFLEPDEVAQLEAAYWSIAPPGEHGLAVDYLRPDRDVMRAVAELLAPVWEPHFAEIFVDQRPVLTSFMTKHPGDASGMFLHEDRTFVDERRWRSGTLWIPLVDVGPGIDNGCLQVVRGSHRLANSWSGTGTEQHFRAYESYLTGRLETLEIPAGSAAYYDTRTLHMSPPNGSEAPRVAIGCTVVPDQAELIHVVATSRRHRHIHRADTRFFIDLHPQSLDQPIPSEYPVIEELDDAARLPPEEVAAVLDPTRPPPDLHCAEPVPAGLAAVLERHPGRTPLRDDDLPVTAGHLFEPGQLRIPDVALDPILGLTGAVAIADHLGTREPIPEWADELRALVEPATHCSIVMVDSGARARLAVSGPEPRLRIDVIDATLDKARLKIGEDEEVLEDTTSLVLKGALEATIVNDGPGVLAILLSRAARDRKAGRRVTSPLRSVARRVRALRPSRPSSLAD